MKSIALTQAAACLLTSLCTYAQLDSSAPLNPFSRGNYELSTRRWVDFLRQDHKRNGFNFGESKDLGIFVGTHYYFTKNFGAGIEFDYDRNVEINSTKFISTDYAVFGYLTGGIPLGRKASVYGRLGVGFGGSKQKLTITGNTTESTSDLFGFRAEVGLPLHWYGDVYFVPRFTYCNNSFELEEGEFDESCYGFEFGLNSYFGCRKTNWGSPYGFSYHPQDYSAGISYFGFNARGGVSFGNTEWSFLNQVEEEEDVNTSLELDYVYQVIQNLGLGAELSYRRMSSDFPAASYESADTYLMFEPGAYYHFPFKNGLNNAFWKFSAGIGSRKVVVESPTIPSTTKETLSKISTGIGYDFFFSKYSMFTFILEYEWHTRENKENDTKVKSNGLGFEVGIRTPLYRR